MSICTRLINIVLFTFLLTFLAVSTICYLYQELPTFNRWVVQQTPWLQQLLADVIRQGNEWHLQPRWVIGGVFAMVLLYFLVGFLKQRKAFHPPSAATMFFINLALVLGIGTILTIYYWPEDTIRLGNIMQLQRGPRDKFLELLLQIGILVVVAHLFVFLLINLWRLLFSPWRRRVNKTKETKIYTKPAETE